MKWEPATAAEANLWAVEALAKQRASEPKPLAEPWSGWAPSAELDIARNAAVVLEQENAWLTQAIRELRAHVAGAVAVGDAWKLRGLDLCDEALQEQTW